MPKLPDNFVKAPRFDNPLRSTAGSEPVERSLVLQFDAVTWDALQAASARDGLTPDDVVRRALEQFLAQPARAAMAPADAPRPQVRAQLLEELRAQVVRRSWVQCFLTLRALVREVRA